MSTNPQPGPWVEAWLSAPRFGVYLEAAGGDRQLALVLYEWNALVSAAFQRDLAHLEVALRNAYDAAIVANTTPGLAHWTTDPYRLFPVRWRAARDGTRIDANRSPREQIERAVREAGPGAPTGKVIAELMFGFWRYLSTAAHHHPLWIPYLHTAFAPGASAPQSITRSVGCTRCATESRTPSRYCVGTPPPACSASPLNTSSTGTTTYSPSPS